MSKFKNSILLFSLVIIFFSTGALGATLAVGPGLQYSGNTQQAINNAINAASSGDTVSLAATTFTISAPIQLKSGVSISGQGIGATIIQCTYTDFAKTNMIIGSSDNNIVISGFTETENLAYSTMHDPGWNNDLRDYNQGVSLTGCNGVTIHDVKYYMATGDFIHCSGGCTNIVVYNTISDPGPGHDEFDAWSCGNGIHIYNNYWGTFENSCNKIDSTKNVEIDHNTFFTTTGSGNAGLEVMSGDCSGLNVHHNVFHQLKNSNIYHDGTDGTCSGTATAVSNNIWYGQTGYSITGMTVTTSTGNIQASSDNSWDTATYGYVAGAGSSMSVYNGTPAITLTTPTSGQSIQSVNGNTVLTWAYLNSTKYWVAYSNSSSVDGGGNLNVNVSQQAVYLTNTLSVPVSSGQTYYWQVAAYNDVTHTYTARTSPWSFTITGNVNLTSTGGVYGNVYDASTKLPIAGAVVSISNNSFSENVVTGGDGIYQFNDIPLNSGTFYIGALATDYVGTSGLPINVSVSASRLDLPLTESPSYFPPHLVSFTVCDPLFKAWSDAYVQVYAPGEDPSSGNPSFSSFVDENGNVAFSGLQEKSLYTLVTTFNTSTQTQIDTISPSGDFYYIFLPYHSSDNVVSTPQFEDTYSINITRSVSADGNTGYINVTTGDNSSGDINSITYVLGSLNGTGVFIPSGITGTQDSFGVVDTATDSFVIGSKGYIGKEYVLQTIVDSDKFGVTTHRSSIKFPNSSTFFTREWGMLGVFLLIIVAAQWSRADAHWGALAVCGLWWVVFFIGMFEGLMESMGFTENTYPLIGAIVVSCLVVLNLLLELEKEGQY